MTEHTRLPLPEPVAYEAYAAMYGPELSYSKKGIKSLLVKLYTANQMRDYAAAENAALRERVKVLEDAVQHYESALRNAWPEGAKGASWEFWNKARIVLSALEKT